MTDKICPQCKSECVREEVDVGVGTIYSPWRCNNCGWEEENLLDDTFKKEK